MNVFSLIIWSSNAHKTAQETNQARPCQVPSHLSALQKHVNIYA